MEKIKGLLTMLLASFVLGSCSKEATTKDVPAPETKELFTLNLSAEVGWDRGELADELKGLNLIWSMNSNGQTVPIPELKDGDKVAVHTAVRNASGSAYGVATLNWTWVAKDEVLKITREDVGNNIPIVGSTDDVYDNEEWYFAGIIGGTLIGNEVVVQQSHTLKVPSGAKTFGLQNLDIPYAFAWTPITPIRSGEFANRHAQATKTVAFKPQGAIVKYRVGNKMGGPLTLSDMHVNTNAFVDNVKFALIPSTGATPNGELPKWSTTDKCPINYVFETNPQLAASTAATKSSGKSFYYAWVMPTEIGRKGGSEVFTQVMMKGNREESFKDYTHTFFTDHEAKGTAMKDGGIYSFVVNAHESVRLPIEYVTHYSLTGGEGNPNAQYVTANRTMTSATGGFRFANRQVDGTEITDFYNQTQVNKNRVRGSIYHSNFVMNAEASLLTKSMIDEDGTTLAQVKSKYHIPSYDEWWGAFVSFGRGGAHTGNALDPSLGWQAIAARQDAAVSGTKEELMCVGEGHGVTVGLQRYYNSEFGKVQFANNTSTIHSIRFAAVGGCDIRTANKVQGESGRTYYAMPAKDNSMRSAWRYRLHDASNTTTVSTNNDTQGNKRQYLEINVVYLGDEAVNLADVENDAWWTERQGRMITRYFALDGFRQVSNGNTSVSFEWGSYWARDNFINGDLNRVRFSGNLLQGNVSYNQGNSLPIRLFYNNAVATELSQK